MWPRIEAIANLLISPYGTRISLMRSTILKLIEERLILVDDTRKSLQNCPISTLRY